MASSASPGARGAAGASPAPAPALSPASWFSSTTSAVRYASSSAASFTSGAVGSAVSATAQGVHAVASTTRAAASATAGLAAATACALAQAPGAVASATLSLPQQLYTGSVGAAHGLVHVQDPLRVADVRARPPQVPPAGAFPLQPGAQAAAREAWRAHWGGMLARALPAAQLAAALPEGCAALCSEWGATLLADAVGRMEDLLDLVAEAAGWGAGGSLLHFALEGLLAELGRRGSEASSEPAVRLRLEAFRAHCVAAAQAQLAAAQAREHDQLKAVLQGSGLAHYVPEFAVGMARSRLTSGVLALTVGTYAAAASLGLQVGQSLSSTSKLSTVFHALAAEAFACFLDVAAHVNSEQAAQGRELEVERRRLAARYRLQGVAEALASASEGGLSRAAEGAAEGSAAAGEAACAAAGGGEGGGARGRG